MPKQRQARESREKNPPVKRTKVFLWRREENGEYRRESFYQAENGMHLDAYGKNQKIYDVFSNDPRGRAGVNVEREIHSSRYRGRNGQGFVNSLA